MARTHAAGTIIDRADYSDGGVVFGKGGEPIPVSPARGVPALHPHAEPLPKPPAEPVAAAPKPEPVPPSEFVFLCDKTTWQRNMDGYQALHLLNAMIAAMFGQELSMTLTEEQARGMKLPADVRWHMRRVPEPAEVPE